MIPASSNAVSPVQCYKSSEDKQSALPGSHQKRQCRDIIFLIIFFVFLGGSGYVSYSAILLGDPERLIFGIDSWGNVCGKRNSAIEGVAKSGRDTTDERNLFYFDKTVFVNYIPGKLIEVDSVAVCVKKCPDKEVTTASDLQNLTTASGSRLCQYDVPITSYGSGHLDGSGHCPPLPIEAHQAILHRCVPDSFNKPLEFLTGVIKHVFDTIDDNFPEKCLSDLEKTWVQICVLSAIGLGVAVLIAVLLRFIASIVIWVIVALLSLGSVLGSSLCWIRYTEIKTQSDSQPGESKESHWLIGSICATILTVIILLVLLVMRKRIALVVELFREAGQTISDIPTLLLMPFCTVVIVSGVLATSAYIFLNIESSGVASVSNSTGFVTYTEVEYFKYIKWCHIVLTIWVVQFIFACEKIAISGAVAAWFFRRDQSNFDFPVLKSIGRLTRYHLGSAVLGSLIITLLRCINWIISYVHKRLKNRDGVVVNFLLNCFKCCFWCFETFMKFLNSNAYVEIAILGLGFCDSARRAFFVVINNAMRLAAINSVGDFTLFLGKLGTVAVVAVVGIELMTERTDVFYSWLPISISCIIAFIVANSFLGVYEVCIDTIFVCFCEDCHRNDGGERPYYMSSNLMRFIEKSTEESKFTPIM